MKRICSYLKVLLLLVPGFVLSSCTRTVEYVFHQPPSEETYLTGYPFGNTGPYLEKMMQSVKRVTSTAYYTTYLFDPADQLTPASLTDPDSPEVLSYSRYSSNQTSAGTAVVIYSSAQRVGLLTANHVISKPDTVYQFADADADAEILESVTIRQRQVNWLIDTAFLGSFEVLAADESADLAIIGARIDQVAIDGSVRSQFPVFPYPFGEPQELTPGAFTYAFGYPRGYPMVTTGVVSNPNRGEYHAFITDALFNPGFSGGAVVAIRDNVPDFEWVGMARSASASSEWLIVPDEDIAMQQIPHHPYRDDIYVRERSRIDYGITHIVPATRIKRFLLEYEELLAGKRYRIRL
ncbi:serine protease [Balneolales bacterium ANBcel1]|nr:serine protease [Balneolales bacterium ANBcel1]